MDIMYIVPFQYGIASVVYATLSVLIVVQARQKANKILAVCCAVTAVSTAFAALVGPGFLEGETGFLDLLRLLAWYAYLLYLYRQSQVPSSRQLLLFSLIAISIFCIELIFLIGSQAGSELYTIQSWPVLSRLFICIAELLLIENLYFNLPESARWHIALPCILLGGLACFDILVVADTALFGRSSLALESGRVIVMIILAPLLVLAAFRGQRWSEPVRLSRAAVFHSATLVLSGSVLLSLAFVGEVLRHLDQTWGWVAELSLVFCGLIGILLFATSRSAKSLLSQIVVSHFFADRYDYRSQWLNCIQTMSGQVSSEESDLHTRAIKAVADVVNSPSGALFIVDKKAREVRWARSWNMPPASNFFVSHPFIKSIVTARHVIDLTKNAEFLLGPLTEIGPLWLAVPLRHSIHTIGLIVVGPPRVTFRTDQEVFDLLEILGQEVGTYVAEQQATEVVVQTQNLHTYGKRFSFVAHDIKNISSQLALLLANAELHIDNPEFQQDMLGTVRASVQKINRLIRRLDEPSSSNHTPPINIVPRIKTLTETYLQTGRGQVVFTSDGNELYVAIGTEAFDTAIGHLLNNAIEAAPMRPVLVGVSQEVQQAIIEIADEGEGMTPEFIRTELFVPFKTRRSGGSGIGAFQAREIVHEAGGEISVFSQRGIGTKIRIVFALTGENDQLEFCEPGRIAGDAGG